LTDALDPAEGRLLRAEQLCVGRAGRDVVRDVTLQLNAGEVVALLGPNGAGKSTLLDALSGVLPPSRGTIELRGRVVVALQSPDLARRSVLANVMLGLAWWGVAREDREDRAKNALRSLGADHLAERSAATLSGGERRRVHLARAMAVRADILMLDEPFAGLDPEARSSLLEDAVSALRSDTRATLVVVHDRAEAWALADRLLILIGGRLVASGPPRDLLEAPPTAEVARFLGFDGALEDAGETILTRPPHVKIDQTGPLRGRVTRSIPLEDGARVEIELEHGRLYTVAALPAPRPGETVRVRLAGGVRFPAGGASSQEAEVAPAVPQDRRP
jgi:ABC-type multidrug transport system ATPase subunit